MARADARYNTWSDRGEFNRPRHPEMKSYNTLPHHPDTRTQSYRSAPGRGHSEVIHSLAVFF